MAPTGGVGRCKVEDTFRAAGAQFVIQNLSQLPDLISALGV